MTAGPLKAIADAAAADIRYHEAVAADSNFHQHQQLFDLLKEQADQIARLAAAVEQLVAERKP